MIYEIADIAKKAVEKDCDAYEIYIEKDVPSILMGDEKRIKQFINHRK